MSIKKIGIDIDDVVAESSEAIRLLVNEVTGSALQKRHYKIPATYWGYYEQVWRQHDVNIDFNAVYEGLKERQDSVGLVPSAQYAINILREAYDVVLITSREAELAELTKQWLSKHFDNPPQVFFAAGHKKTGLQKTKGEICEELGVDLMIDDHPGHCNNVLEHGVQAILFGEYGWHLKEPINDRVIRCRDWPAVLEYIQHASEAK